MKNVMLMAVVVLALAPSAVFAATETVDGVTWRYEIRNGQAIIYGNGETDPAIPISTSGRVVVPKTLGGVSVSKVGRYAFANCKNLKRIVIPEGVEGCDWESFYGCGKLDAITIPSTFKNVGSGNIFYGTSTKELHISSVESWMEIDNNDYWSSLPSAEMVFLNGVRVTEVKIPEGYEDVRGYCFNGFGGVNRFIIPATVKLLRGYALKSDVDEIVFLGDVPAGLEASNALSCKKVWFPRKYASAFFRQYHVSAFGGFVDADSSEVEYVSVAVRANDPTILDCVYKVKSAQPTVKVRALAFQDGERSFAKVVRPETFVADTNGVETAGNVGDAIVPNVPHTLSWRVSSDWSNRLAKVSFEVLATEGELLPLEVRTIPASDAYGKMDVSWNAISERQWFDALLWLYADKCEKLSVRDGVCFYDGKMTASGTTLNYNKTASSYYSRTYNSETKQYDYVRYINTSEAVLDAMGYKVLSGEVLNYVNEETRLGLSPRGYRQYGYKIVSEK